MAILPNLNDMTKDQLIALLAQAQAPRALSMKVSEKGAISIYGLGRFPITLYASQMDRLLNHSDAIRAFMKANQSLLAVKA
jgi:hypothetical protein